MMDAMKQDGGRMGSGSAETAVTLWDPGWWVREKLKRSKNILPVWTLGDWIKERFL